MRSVTHSRLEHCTRVSTGAVNVLVRVNKGPAQYMRGRIVDIAPHITCATFALHPAVNEPGWCVTDTGSGFRVGFSAVSEADAVSLAAANLAMRTDDDIRRAREKGLRMAAAAAMA